MKAFTKLGFAILMGGAATLASAQERQHTSATANAGSDAVAAAELTEGEVRKIDKEAGKITLRHGEIKNLNMAAMTMVLRVQDPAMLEQVQVGDKLKFAAERVNGAITVVHMQKLQ